MEQSRNTDSSICDSLEMPVIILTAIFYLFSLWLWNSTYYKIEDGFLLIKCWIFRKGVKIADIESVKNVTNIYSSYALSVKRLEIKYKNWSIVYIAPVEEEKFKQELMNINGSIIFKAPDKLKHFSTRQ